MRRYFKEELAMPQPALRDAWYPYAIAFGLEAIEHRRVAIELVAKDEAQVAQAGVGQGAC